MRVDADALRRWPLPRPEGDKRARGDVVVIGGSLRSPGAVRLAGEAALRAGAGRLTIVLSSVIAVDVATSLPECGVVPLTSTRAGGVLGRSVALAANDLAATDAVLVGPGLDDLGETCALLDALPAHLGDDVSVVLDAYALGALALRPSLADAYAGRLVLTPNRIEAAALLGRELGDSEDPTAEIAARFQAVVSCFGTVADADGKNWTVEAGNSGLGTSGSGDVLAGTITGLSARGATPEQAATWGTWAHGTAGEALADRIGPIGFLASELLPEIPRALALPAPKGSGDTPTSNLGS